MSTYRDRIREAIEADPKAYSELVVDLLEETVDFHDSEAAEKIYVKVFGPRVECECGALKFPSLACWSCEEEGAP